MEAVAAIGLVSSIVQLVNFTSQVSKRLLDFSKAAGTGFTFTKDLEAQLPLILCYLKRIQTAIEAGDLPTEDKRVVDKAAQGCRDKINDLDRILDRVLPNPTESRRERMRKAIKSLLRYDKEIEAIQQSLVQYLVLLGPYANATVPAQATDNSAAQQVILFDVPVDRDEDFVGRQSILGEIGFAFESKRRVALYGLGGAGSVHSSILSKLYRQANVKFSKTQIAVEYCNQYVKTNPASHVFWVPCSSQSQFIQAYQNLARRLNITGWNDMSLDSSSLVTEWLNDPRNADWLLVLDNADDQELFYPSKGAAGSDQTSSTILQYLPKPSSGQVLITSRNKHLSERLAGRTTTLAVPEFDPDEALQLLHQKIPDWKTAEDNDLQAVAEYLDYLPLALTQAAAFLHVTGISIAEYLDLLKDKDNFIDLLEEDYGDERRDVGNIEHSNSVIKTWKISFDRLFKQTPDAAELLCLMSMLDRTGIPQQLLEDIFDTKVEYLTCIAALQASSFVKTRAAEKSFSMHRLVQMAIQRWIHSRGETSVSHDCAYWAIMLQFCLHGSSFDFIAQPIWSKLYPHAIIVLDYSVSTEEESLRAQLQLWIGLIENRMGKDDTAHERVLSALSWFQANRGEQSLLVSKCKGALSRILESKGLYEEACDLQQQVLEARKEIYGNRSTFTIDSMESLAGIYLELGRYEEAEGYLNETLELLKIVHGEDNPRNDTTKALLSRVYRAQGRVDEAEQLQLNVLSARRRNLPPDHWKIYAVMSELARTYAKQKRFAEAEEFDYQILLYFKQRYHEPHPHLVDAMTNLAITLWDAGRYDEARSLGIAASHQCYEIYPRDHRQSRLMEGLLEDLGVKPNSDRLRCEALI